MDTSRTAQYFLNFGHTVDHFFMLIYPTVVLVMAPEFGMTYGEMLPLSIGSFIMFGAGSLPAGWLADRWSRRGMIILFFTGIGTASILTGFARTQWQIAAGMTLIGTFAAIYHPVGIAMLVSGREKVGRVLGVNGVWGNLGVAFAALIAGALAYWINWRAAYIIPGMVAIATGIAYAVLVPPDFGLAAVRGKAVKRAFPRSVLAQVFIVTAVTTICGGIIFNSTTIAMPKVFDERLAGLISTTLGIGVLVSLVYAFAALAQLCVGWWIDRSAIKPVFVLVVAMQVPLLLLAGASEHITMLVVALAMMFFVFGQIPINDTMVAAYTDERWRARAYSVRYVVSFLGSALSVPLVAYLYRTTGDFRQLFFVLAGLAFVSFLATITMPGAEQKEAPLVERDTPGAA